MNTDQGFMGHSPGIPLTSAAAKSALFDHTQARFVAKIRGHTSRGR
jgi:hypothetical protein